MNFLLHRHLAARDLGSVAAGAGAMLPDLWRMADRRVKPARAPERPAAPPPRLAEVLAGIDHHVAVDRWFHAAPVFVEGERRLAEALRGAALGAPRLALFAHVLWEMCLDGALVRRIGLAPLLDDLRAGLASIDGPPTEAAACIHHFERRAPSPAVALADRPAFEARLRRICDELARGPWIAGYQDGAGLAFMLSRVRSRFGMPPFTPEQHDRLAPLLDGLAGVADASLDDILRTAPPCAH
ncbi:MULTISPECIES: hypothetical protein [Sorangium]|uniref:DUF479 domain-containing protein n=1 Tax=Sorangium cellulosum TaxID=56 RepID=A0A4P2QQ59_SORCE|nr:MULTISPECIES: hypothetical protein [Sorangium]AUX31643.1 hypothetical protein SOCE836_037740 [Sorangium cellulosum]WCQ91020.1 hypothetical protein NQZ70_03735 [Sorangium sp. Soce836]